jgi:hypothetical protein
MTMGSSKELLGISKTAKENCKRRSLAKFSHENDAIGRNRC